MAEQDLIEVRPGALVAQGAAAAPALDDSPRAEIRLGLAIAILFFVLFLGWAAFAPMDAAAYGPGRVSVSGQRQTVQHRDGGVVGAILVKEGQRVRAGQVLLSLAAAEVRAEERALSGQAIGLLAQRARLRAEQLGQSDFAVPPEYAELPEAYRAEAEEAMKIQRTQLRARASLLNTQQGVLGQQKAQVGQESLGYRRQLTAVREQERLITEELESLRTVADKGFVSKNRIRALERAKAELGGQAGRLEAAISQAAESVGETSLRVVETERARQDSVAVDLRDVELTLADILPKLNAARDRLARTEVRAPATGTVVGLSIFTVGGVISPGQKLMDIVPDRTPLVVEARFAPEDVDDLEVGQKAVIRFTGLQDRDLPTLEGQVTRVSADSFVDEKSGAAYFTGEVAVPPEDLRIIQRARGSEFALKPGMPVEVLIPMRKRTALQYLIQPLSEALWRSFREH
jgi:HlyD family secretion protein